MTLLQLLERQPVPGLHQVDQPEVARPQHHDLTVGYVVLRSLLRLPPGRLVDRGVDHRVLLVTPGEARHSSLLERPLDELVEAVPVPLLEGRALGLPVIREDYEFIGTR